MIKYGCCCCLEERSWIAALTMIGLKRGYGTKQACGKSGEGRLYRAPRSLLSERLLRLEDATWIHPNVHSGDVTMDITQDCKRQGFYFAQVSFR
jgi:hypothetical protein